MVTPDRNVRKLMSKYQKSGKVAVAAARADLALRQQGFT